MEAGRQEASSEPLGPDAGLTVGRARLAADVVFSVVRMAPSPLTKDGETTTAPFGYVNAVERPFSTEPGTDA
jgi:hypothetical protein